MKFRNHVLCAVALVAVGVATFSNSVSGEFHYDDYRAIVHNQYVTDFDSSTLFMRRGISIATFALDYQRGKLNPAVYHQTNIALHLIVILLIYLLVGTTLRARHKRAWWIAFLTAAFFSVHPLITEPVNYISARLLMVCAVFYLGALLCLVRAMDAEHPNPSIAWGAGALLLGLGACLSKEVGLTLPLAALLHLAAFRSDFPTMVRRAIVRWQAVGMGILLFAVFAWSIGIPAVLSEAMVGVDGLALAAYWMGQSNVLARYLGLSLWPSPSLLNVNQPVSLGVLDTAAIFTSMILIGLMLYLGIRLLSRYPVVGFGLVWWLLLHAPTSIVPRENPMVEYRNYLPLLGLCWLVAACLVDAAGRINRIRNRFVSWAPQAGLGSAAAALLIVMSIASVHRNEVWNTNETLWVDSVRKNPQHPRGYAALGCMLIQAKDTERAREYALTSLALPGGSRNDRAVAEEYLLQVKESREGMVAATASYHLGRLYQYLHDESRAIRCYEQAAKTPIFFAPSRLTLGFIWANRRSWRRAEECFDDVLAEDPSHYEGLFAMARVQFALGDRNQAYRVACRAQALRPDASRVTDFIRFLQGEDL